MGYKKPPFPLKGSQAVREIREAPEYKNPSDNPVIKEVMAFCIFQEAKELQSIQDKNTTPRDNALKAEKILIGKYSDVPPTWKS